MATKHVLISGLYHGAPWRRSAVSQCVQWNKYTGNYGSGYLCNDRMLALLNLVTIDTADFLSVAIFAHGAYCSCCFVQNHTAISRSLSILTVAYGVVFTRCVGDAYLHFEAMTDHSYEFKCALCGHYPYILILDGHRKCAFRLHCKLFQ